MMPTDAIAPWFFLFLVAAGVVTWLYWRRKWRRDDRRARALAAGIADERRISPYEDEPTVEIVLDESVTRIYTEPGWTMFRGGLVHTACLGRMLLDDARPCAGCAVHLDHVLTGAT